MRKLLCLLAMLVMVPGMVGSALAETTWNGNANPDWWEASSWTGGVPNATQKTNIRGTITNGPIIVSGDAVTLEIDLTNSLPGSVLGITGGTLLAKSWFIIGYNGGTDRAGTFNVSGGVVTVDSNNLTVGREAMGYVNMTGDGKIVLPNGRDLIVGSAVIGYGKIVMSGNSRIQASDLVTFGVSGTAELIMSDDSSMTVGNDLQFGDNGSGKGYVIMNDNASITLTGADYLKIGDDGAGELTMNDNAAITMGTGVFYVAENGTGTLMMNGGSITTGGPLTVSRDNGSRGTVLLYGGTITAHHAEMQWAGATTAQPRMDFRKGTLILTDPTTFKRYVDDGYITAYGGEGELVYDTTTIPDKTIITATFHKAWNPSPADNGFVSLEEGEERKVILDWIDADPNTADPNSNITTTYVDVWFGTDTGTWTKIVDGQDTNGLVVEATLPVNGSYVWRVDSYLEGDPATTSYGGPGEPTVSTGDQWSFMATDDKPVVSVDLGDDMISWSGQATPLNAVAVDPPSTSVTHYNWSAEPGYGVTFDPADPDMATPTVTVDTSKRTTSNAIAGQEYDAEQHINNHALNTDSNYGSFDLQRTGLEVGSEDVGGLDWQTVGLVFKDLGIPQGSTINSAKITFTVSNPGNEYEGNSNDFTLFVQPVDNAPDFLADPNIITREKSAASVAWAPAGSPAVGSKVDTPDIKVLIQEIVNREGWSPNNNLALMIYPDVYLALADPLTGGTTPVQEIECYAGMAEVSNRATLTVTYDMPAGAEPSADPIPVTITVVINDETYPDTKTDSMTIDVYDTACKATLSKALAADNPTDFNKDCITDLDDFADFAAAWLDDYSLTGPIED